jgi:hypothetical protein
MRKIVFLFFLFILLEASLFCKDRERIIFGIFYGHSFSTGHYENKKFKFGEFNGYNFQAYLSQYLGFKIEWIKQDAEVSYIHPLYLHLRHERWKDYSLIIDYVLKYPRKPFTPYVTLGFGYVFTNGESLTPKLIARFGAGFKMIGRISDFLFLNLNLSLNYFTKYKKSYINQWPLSIHNNQRWSIPFGIEFGF